METQMQTKIKETFEKYHPTKTILDCFDKPFGNLCKHVGKIQTRMDDKVVMISNSKKLMKKHMHPNWDFIFFYKDRYFGGEISTIEKIIKHIDDIKCIVCLKEKNDMIGCSECDAYLCIDCCSTMRMDENEKVKMVRLKDKSIEFTKIIECPKCKTVTPMTFGVKP